MVFKAEVCAYSSLETIIFDIGCDKTSPIRPRSLPGLGKHSICSPERSLCKEISITSALLQQFITQDCLNNSFFFSKETHAKAYACMINFYD